MNRFATSAAATLILLSPATSALGQTTLLISGGLSLASMTSSDEELNSLVESSMGMSIGLTAGIPVSESLNLELGASYSQKGFATAEGTLDLGYLDVTALASKPFPMSDRASVHLLAGPALAYKVSCQVTVSFEAEEFSEDCDDEFIMMRSMDLGLAGGVRFEIGLSEKAGLSVGAFYTYGLLNQNVDDNEALSIKHRVLTLRAGLAYSIG